MTAVQLLGECPPSAAWLPARVNGWVVSQAVVITTGVAADGHWEVLGSAVGNFENGALYRISAHVQSARTGRHPAGHFRRPHRAQGRVRPGAVALSATT